MITLLTGLPGNGKTLFALYSVNAKALKEHREVFYHNIKDLTLPWTVFDPQKWMDLPHGAIIVIDEAQDVFPKKPNGATLPEYYSELAKHRHKGFDIFLITQHPTLLDNFVRQLVGQHYHSIRKFGMERSTIYEWSAANPAPQNASSHKNAIMLKWAYPKEVYTYYKSAEVHTVKRAIPMRLILAVLFIVAVLGIGYYALHTFKQRGQIPAPSSGPVSGGSPGQATASAGDQAVKPFDRLADSRNFVDMATPRIAGLPQTAPKYDGRTKPTHVPVPAACIQSASNCRCFTQQGSAMDVEKSMCIGFARNGFFQEFDPDGERQQPQKVAQSVAVLEHPPVGRAVDSLIPSVALLGYDEPNSARVAPVASSPRSSRGL